MSLPFLDRARIAPAKIRDYLLNPEYPVGRAKARFFTGLGFTREGWAELHAALLGHAALGETQALIPTPFGRKCLIRGTIGGPNGTEASVVAVWILDEAAEGPRFATAYPEEKP
jgi:Domain of unknown function (DUF6883)